MVKEITIAGSVDLNYNGNLLISKGIHGQFSFSSINSEKPNIIESIFVEAQRKYPRMHSDNVSKRFGKSWTGYIGEEVIKVVIKEQFDSEILARSVNIDSSGYDGGDVYFMHNNKQLISNVSTRKLSANDSIRNVVVAPQNYFALIPTDQFNQYTSKCDLAFFVFILFDKQSIVNITIDEFNLSVNLTGSWIVPGYLKSADLKNMKSNSYLYIKKKGDILKGLYSDLEYGIPMYTDNFVIFINMLRGFKMDKI